MVSLWSFIDVSGCDSSSGVSLTLGVILVSGVSLILVSGVNFRSDSVFRSEFETRNLPENIREIWGPVLLQKLPDDVQNRCAFAVHKSVPPSCSDNFDSIRFFDISTRMHSSRMRIVRCSGLRGMSAQEGVCLGGVCPGRCLPRGVCLGVSAQGGVCPSTCWDTPLPVDRIFETLPLSIFVCGR